MIDDLEQVKRDVQELQSEYDRTEGALRQVKDRLREDYGVQTIKEARAKRDKLRQKRQQEAEEWAAAFAAFKKALAKRRAKRGCV